MEALIHHFKLFTEGFRVPPGETYSVVESPAGRDRLLPGVGRVAQAGAHAHPRPVLLNLQSMDAMVPGCMFADAVAIVSSIDPIMGEVDR